MKSPARYRLERSNLQQTAIPTPMASNYVSFERWYLADIPVVIDDLCANLMAVLMSMMEL